MSTQKDLKRKFLKIKDFLIENESKLVLVVGFLLISGVSFEIGILKGEKWRQEPLVIEKPVYDTEAKGGLLEVRNEPSRGVLSVALESESQPEVASGCAYVGSKNSNKFYLPSCSWARSIKPENVICFKTAQEALSKGRTESKCN